MPDTWYKNWCSKCETVNWVCDGDTTDLSGIDIDGIKCRKCGHIDLFNEEMYNFDADMNGWKNKEECNWKLGLETPN